MYSVIKVIFILMLIHLTQQTENKSDERKIKENDIYIGMLSAQSALILIIAIRSSMARYNVSLPYAVFVLIIGILWGLTALKSKKIQDYVAFAKTYYLIIIELYVPVMIFKIAFCLDVHTFLKSIYQILIISIPLFLVTAITFGLISRIVINLSWPYSFAVLFGVLSMPTYPREVTNLLRETVANTKHVTTLLEGEALCGMMTSAIVGSLIIGNDFGYITKWYYFMLLVFRCIIIGSLSGLLVGWLGRLVFRRIYASSFTIVLTVFALPFLTFSLAEWFIRGSGIIAVAIMGVMMSLERTVLSSQTDTLITNFWKILIVLFNIIVCLTASLFLIKRILPEMKWTELPLVLVTYVLSYVVRFISFLIFSPILSRIGYGLTGKSMLICVWGGLKSPFSLLVIMAAYLQLDFKDQLITHFCMHIYFLYFLSLLINGTSAPLILRVMGLSQISMARQVNMNNCMKHIFLKKNKTINILKMDRFLVDCNWDVVRQATTMKHPYTIFMDTTNEDNEFFMGYRFTYCDDCRREILEQPTLKELKEIRREAKMRVLKTKKISYHRQYENGMVSKEGIRILKQAVETAMDTEEAVIEMDGLYKKFHETGCFQRFIKKRMEKLQKQKTSRIKPPRTYWRRKCYHICFNTCSIIFIHIAILLNEIVVIMDVLQHFNELYDDVSDTYDKIIFALNTIFYIFFLTEFVVKIMAFSTVYICRDGFAKYFKYFWNIFDFVLLIVTMLDEILECFDLFDKLENNTLKQIENVIKIIKPLRVLRFLRFVAVLYPSTIKRLDKQTDTNMVFTYELGKSYVTGEKDTLEMLPYIIDNESVRDEIRQKVEFDYVNITKLLGLVQKQRPWIAITVKTKQAIATVLNSMRDAFNELKTLGWIDQFEQNQLQKSFEKLYKILSGIRFVPPSSPKVIFKEMPWMANNEAVFDFLFENVTVKKFETGDVVFSEGKVADGIYIIVSGFFELIYTPSTSVLESLQEFGHLPIVDYLSCSQFDEIVTDYIVAGNSIGILSALTERPYNCIITAHTSGQVYVLSRGIIKRAMELNPDPINGLECRLWKVVAIRIAFSLLISTPTYQSSTQDQIKYVLERAFVPNLSYFKIFIVTEMIKDIVLIEGVVADFNTKKIFIAPCYIPRTVQKIILPKSSLIQIPIDIEAKILIIPEQDIDPYDIMLNAEEICELTVSETSSRCLHHLIQERHSRSRRRRFFHKSGISIGTSRSTNESSSLSPQNKVPSLSEESNCSSMDDNKSKQSSGFEI